MLCFFLAKGHLWKDTRSFILVLNKTTISMNKELTVPIHHQAALDNNLFSAKLFGYYTQLKTEKDKNIFFSPFSIFTALAMTGEGAKNETALQIQQLLHLSSEDSIRQKGLEELITSLNSLSTNFVLFTANALWVQKEYSLLNTFLNDCEKYYKAKIENLDFLAEPELSRQTINQWVEENTKNKIKELVPKNLINTDTRLLLTNSIYFKAAWAKNFEEEDTKDGIFTTACGEKINVKMMQTKRHFPYTETSDAQILEMPYKNNEVSMIIILPKEGYNIESVSTESNLKKIVNHDIQAREKVMVFFPKFKIEATYSLADDLKNLGISTAFDDQADFSGMTGYKDLRINQVLHKTFIEVTEQGTEAAAATVVGMEAGSAPRNDIPKYFIANRPFIFAIKHRTTGAVLFMGRVNNPEEN
jgi:serpin B